MAYSDYHKMLPKEERKLLNQTTVLSGLLLLVVTLLLAYGYLAISAGDPLAPFATLSIVNFYVDQIVPSDFSSQWWGFIIAPAFMLAAYRCLDIELKKSLKSYDEDNMQLRQGLTGEMVATNRSFLLLVAFCNIFEELLFRGTIIPICLAIAAFLGFGGYPASMFALIISMVLFWFVHADYRNKTSIIVTLFGGLMLGMFYLMWENLIIVYLCHILYNFYVITGEQRKASEDPDYFGGKQPLTLLLDGQKKGRNEKAAQDAVVESAAEAEAAEPVVEVEEAKPAVDAAEQR